MTMNDTNDVRDLLDREAVDPNGSSIGRVTDVYLDDESGEPTWLALSGGSSGGRATFAPLEGVYLAADEVVVAHDKSTVDTAPGVDPDGHLNPDEEQELYRHYGLSGGGATWTGNDDTDVDLETTSDVDVDTSRSTDDAMTRSEEEVDVSTRTTEAGRARLRKWVETEQVSMSVPVRREKARLVVEPVTDANRGDAMAGTDLTEDVHEVTLSEEVVDVDKRVVAKERVRLETDTETEEVTVDESVRKERIAMDGDDNSTLDR